MKISPYMNLNRIEFIVTYSCTGRCIHCSLGNKLHDFSMHRHVEMDPAADAVKKLAQLFPISSVMTFGGEPLLFPDVVCAIHQTAASCGIEARQLITNGYFSKNPQRIREVSEMLNDSGVNDLRLSVDAFHQQIIPLAYVYSFAEFAKQAGVPQIYLHPAWLVNREYDNPYNTKTEELLAEFSGLDIPISSGNDIFMAGNAVKYLSEYYAPPKLNLSDRCGLMPYTEPLDHITSLTIVPNGNVMICNYVIGNIYTEDIAAIVSRYNPYDNIYMSTLLSGGVCELAAAAEANGIFVNPLACYSICDLCRKIAEQ